ncbi:putative secreted protein (Por secretion system target) [Gramella sp. Hel_I_59]|nr:putative secreted protein (Por secretion system target) [Gramella sp. Hel_I_59]
MLVVLMISIFEAVAQTPPLPPQTDCVSQDLLVVQARLDAPTCVDCDEGTQQSFPLILSINNKTGSFRPTFAFFGTLEVRDAEGNLISTETISGCNDTDGLPANTITELPYPPINYTCGTNLKITNLYLAWTDASQVTDQSSKNSCTNITTNITSKGVLDIAPKCGTLDELNVETPLSGAVSTTDSSCYQLNDAEIEALPVGGLAPYTYSWSNGETTKTTTGLAPGTYSVTITDANGCTYDTEGMVGEPTELQAIVDSSTNVSCNGDSDGAIDISVSGGTADYTYLWSNNATTQDISGIPAGTYSVTVTDANGCSDTIDNIQITEPDELMAEVDDATNVSCNGELDGAIDISVVGGTPDYTYLWSNSATTQDISGIPAGTYSVTVTDANGCSDTIDNIQINEPDELVASVTSVTNATCNGELDGAIDISVVGGTPDYTYLWSNNATTQDLSGVAAGLYSVTVTDANGCTDTIDNIEIEDPSTLEAEVDATTNVSCNGYSDGSIDISVSGGTPDYTYLWSNNATTQDISGLTAGTYSVMITDANGCIYNLNDIQIGQPDELMAEVDDATNVSCNGDSDGAIDISVSGGTADYTYLWSNNATTQDISGIPAGTYSVTVTDANGCSDTIDNIQITEPDELMAEVDDATNVSCNGDSDGAIDISVSGGTADYTYLWSNSATTQDISGIPAGTYSVTVTDANGCSDTIDNIQINEPDELVASVTSVTNATCNGELDGAIDISVVGGTPDYTYLWSNNATTQDLSGVAAGLYSVTVTDANGCTDTIDNIEIEDPSTLEAEVDATINVSCNGYSDGSIDISVSGGTPDYTYLWSNNATTQDISGIPAGTYSVTVTDANGCSDTIDNIQITEPDELMAEVDDATNVSCNGDSDGAIDISVSGGTADYTYLWSNNATTQDISGIPAGTYSVTVTDANGCSDTIDNIQINEPDELVASVTSVTNATCNGELDGAIDISVVGGTPDYTYLWSNNATTQDISGLTAGTYSVMITDANGCIYNLNDIQIGQPDELMAEVDDATNVSCNGDSDGAIDISVSGGTADYTYLWSNNATTQDISGIPAGTYSVTVTDANGCSDTIDNIQITEPDELMAEVDDATNVSCNGDSDGAIDISVSGGTADYTYLWSNSATTQDISGIPAGTYSVTVTDANGCTDTIDNIQINEPDELVASVTSVTNATCNGELDGAIDISVVGGTPDYTYLWSNNATTQDLSGVAAGLYSVTVTDANGCTDTIDNIEIEDPSTLEAEVDATTNVSCNGYSDGSIDISVSGGTPDYTYLWSNNATTQDISGLTAGTYSVMITDANGCTYNLNDIQVTEPDILDVQIVVEDVSCSGFDDGSITFTATGGTPPYTSQHGDFNEFGVLMLSGLTPQEYGIVVSDANECGLAIDSIIISEPDEIVIPEIQTQLADCIGGDGSFIFLGDPQNLYISFDDGLSFELYVGAISLSIGLHDFVIKYGEDGCVSDSGQVEIQQIPATNFPLDLTITQPDCDTGLGNVVIRVGANSNIDTEFFTYRITSGETVLYAEKQSLAGFDLPPGDYVIFGLSDNGCDSGRTEIRLEEPICENFQGCTLGYWKNHTDRWSCYSTCTLYSDVFGNSTPSQLQGKTLLEVLNQGGGGIYNLGRQSVAALLNICNGDVNYEIVTEAELIVYVQDNFSNAGAAGSYLDELNNAGCTLGGSKATSAPSEGCEEQEDTRPGKGKPTKNSSSVTSGFKASPVPFKERLTVQYDFEYTSNVTIQVYDLKGQLLRTYKDRKVTKGDRTELAVDFRMKANQVYILRVATDREVFSKNVVSARR